MNDRYVAFKILQRIEKDKAYSNLTLDSYLTQNSESLYSSAFVSVLVYGVCERLLTLDYILSKYLRQPLKKLKPDVLTVLRMGVYQLKFMDSVPASAAVNESVKLIKKSGSAFASGLVNSVLRNVSNDEIEYPQTDNIFYDLSIRYSCPESLVKQFADDYSIEDAEGILSSSLGRRSITARVNTLKTDTNTLVTSLKSDGIDAEKSELLENYIIFNKVNDIEGLLQFKEGLFHIQDISSGFCVKALDAHEGMTVLDVCSAPGSKSFSAAEDMNNKGRVLSFDIYEQRVGLINKGAKRLGIDIISSQVQDASVFNPSLEGIADRVLCDVPCSCLGTIGHKPEIKYKDFAFIDKLCELQYNIISNSARYLKDSGQLVYSTCSLSKRENEQVCERFLNEHSFFEAVGEFKTYMPHRDYTDGFFVAVFRRKN